MQWIMVRREPFATVAALPPALAHLVGELVLTVLFNTLGKLLFHAPLETHGRYEQTLHQMSVRLVDPPPTYLSHLALPDGSPVEGF